jgi:hypothetical protein
MKVCCRNASAVLACILISVAIALAVPNGNGKAKGKDKDHHSQSADEQKENHKSVSVSIFAQGDRDLIRHHFSANRGNLPPGLAKRNGNLPPGLEKQLQRNGHLPPGLEKKLSPFPVELERRLPPLQEGLTRGVIEGRAVIMDRKTSLILDIFAVQ